MSTPQSFVKRTSLVKTTGKACALLKSYKSMLQLRLKAHEKFANRICLLAAPLPGGGYTIYPWLPAHP